MDEDKIRKVQKSGIRYGANDEWMSIPVLLESGGEAFVFIGGDVKVWFDDRYNRAKAHVKYQEAK